MQPSAGALRIQGSNRNSGLQDISSFRQEMKILDQRHQRAGRQSQRDQEFYFPSSSPSEVAEQKRKVNTKFDLKYEPSKFTEELNDSRNGTSYIESAARRGNSQADSVNVDLGMQYEHYSKSFTRAQKSLIELNLLQQVSPMSADFDAEESVLTASL